jgi:uncharacterized membrane protein
MTDRGLRLAIRALALVGIGIASYLVYVHYADISPICVSGGGGCERVQASKYAEVAGVPVALIGLIGYVIILASTFVPGENGRMLGALLGLGAFGFSAYLTYLELFEIDAICQWCVGSAIVATLIAILASIRMVRGPDGVTAPAGSPAAAPH